MAYTIKFFFMVTIIFNALCYTGTVYATQKELSGAGATFPQPFYQKLFDMYYRQYGIRVAYQGTGSGDGIKKIINKAVDFAGADVRMNENELKETKLPSVHIPTCLGAVAITYNLSGNPKLKFTPDVIADIFLGKITKWNDPKIAAINQGVKLPDLTVNVVYRLDSSGTTYIFSDYMSKVSREWLKTMGTDKSLNWRTGQGAKGNPGVAGLIRQIPGSIGYMELIYAIGNNMTVGSIRNMSGKFIEPTTRSIELAGNITFPDESSLSVTNTPVQYGYPISGFSWIIVYKDLRYEGMTREKADELVKLLWWITHEGQRHAEPLHYTPLPKLVVSKAEDIIGSITYNGIRILK